MSDELVYFESPEVYRDKEPFYQMESSFEDQISDKRLFNALKILTKKQKKIIEMRFYKNMKIIEIAEELNSSQSSISEILKRALEKIRKHIED